MVVDKKYWHDVGAQELKEALAYAWNTNVAKNVVLFVGDGMSPDTIAASRIYRAGESSYLAWERFPHVGLLKVRPLLVCYHLVPSLPESLKLSHLYSFSKWQSFSLFPNSNLIYEKNHCFILFLGTRRRTTRTSRHRTRRRLPPRYSAASRRITTSTGWMVA